MSVISFVNFVCMVLTCAVPELVAPVEHHALPHELVGVRRDHVRVVPPHVVPAEVVHDDLRGGAGAASESWVGTEARGTQPTRGATG